MPNKPTLKDPFRLGLLNRNTSCLVSTNQTAVVLDNNKAYSPYCAVNPYSSCPIPPKENRLITRVEASMLRHIK